MLSKEEIEARRAELRKEAYDRDVAASYQMWPDTPEFHSGMVKLMHRLKDWRVTERNQLFTRSKGKDLGDLVLDSSDLEIADQIINHHIDELREVKFERR